MEKRRRKSATTTELKIQLIAMEDNTCANLCVLHTINVSHVIQLVQGGPKNVTTCFYQNFVKSSPNLIIFGTQMAKMIELCEVYSLSTSPHLCQCTTV